MLNIITVWYNEEINLKKFFESLKYIKSKIEVKHFFVDQSSDDNTAEIAKNNWCEVYIHPNKWYADPDKKWIVENFLKNEDWWLILDCDEELIKELSDEIIEKIENNKDILFQIWLSTNFLWIKNWYFVQSRLFKKKIDNNKFRNS